MKISTPAITLYWRNDTHTAFVTWPYSSQNQFAPGLVRPGLFDKYYCLFFFFKLLIPYFDSLDKWHTSAFNASIYLKSMLFSCSVKPSGLYYHPWTWEVAAPSPNFANLFPNFYDSHCHMIHANNILDVNCWTTVWVTLPSQKYCPAAK